MAYDQAERDALRGGSQRLKDLARVEHTLIATIARRLQEIGQLGDGPDANITGAIHGVIDGYVSWKQAAKQAEAERDGLRAEIDATWRAIENGYDIESRAELEAQAKTNGFRYGLAQALHHIHKRRVKENFPPTEAGTLRATLAAVREKLEETDNAGSLSGVLDCVCEALALLDGTAPEEGK